MASLRWRRDAVGFVLDMPERRRERVLKHTAHLRRFPELGLPVSGLPLANRRLIIGPYSVLYNHSADDDVVSIISIARGGPLFH